MTTWDRKNGPDQHHELEKAFHSIFHSDTCALSRTLEEHPEDLEVLEQSDVEQRADEPSFFPQFSDQRKIPFFVFKSISDGVSCALLTPTPPKVRL